VLTLGGPHDSGAYTLVSAVGGGGWQHAGRSRADVAAALVDAALPSLSAQAAG
jgi:hypothetical protein